MAGGLKLCNVSILRHIVILADNISRVTFSFSTWPVALTENRPTDEMRATTKVPVRTALYGLGAGRRPMKGKNGGPTHESQGPLFLQ